MNEPLQMPAIEVPGMETGNLLPILHQVRHALEELLDSGKETTIDLRALPLAPGEEKRLEEALGRGEIQVRLDALGESLFQETRYSGVWYITHWNAEGEVLGKTLEITRLPAMILAQEEEMRSALEALEERLQPSTSGEN